MFKKNKDKNSFEQSSLGRKKKRRSIFKAFIPVKAQTVPSQMVMEEEGQGANLSVRIIIALLVIHIIILAGIGLHRVFSNGGPGQTPQTALAAPVEESPKEEKAQAEATPAQKDTPAPKDTPPVVIKESTKPLVAENKAVQEGAPKVQAANDDEMNALVIGNAVDPDEKPVAPTASNTAAQTYLTQAGDGWIIVARKFKLSVEELKKANPRLAQRPKLLRGVTLIIPQAGSANSAPAQAQVSTDEDSKAYYTVKSGDTLSKIAKNNKTSLEKLLKLNEMTAKQGDRISIDQKIRIR